MYLLNSIFSLFTSFTSILFLKFSIVFSQIALFVNMSNTFLSLPLFVFAFILFCVLNSIYGFSHCNSLKSNMRGVFLVLILVSSKVVSFHNESHTFVYQKKLGTNISTLAIGILLKSAIFNLYLGSISYLIFIFFEIEG